ncbi:ATP-binding protein [Rothia sp. P5766]|uniref:BbrUII/HgiDII family restriction enzyme n=1 Tax=Rothia sp. P5766 TaxID=3402656 RepID=UPI003AD97170
MSEYNKYRFSVSLAVIESLGVNLYSNAASVLSELVANAWDADANNVYVKWEDPGQAGQVSIFDDGCGMNSDEINNRFLQVAYQKREDVGDVSPIYGRPYMGRKGIGKLSVFSIANNIKVFSLKNGEKNGFEINVPDLMQAVRSNSNYYPLPIAEIEFPEELKSSGTKIILSDLKLKRVDITKKALKKRLARRFDVLNFDESDEAKFSIYVDGDKITYEDRDDLQKVEYIWHIGQRTIPDGEIPKTVKKEFFFDQNIIDSEKDWKINGWIGASKKPDDLKRESEQEALRNIIVLSRRRPIQEKILDDLGFNKIFSSYVTGQINADFLDDTKLDDIATSDRQRLMEDDPRVRGIIKKLREILNHASEEWANQRKQDRYEDQINEMPVLKDWVDGRPKYQQKSAQKMLKNIAYLNLDNKSKGQLYKSSILAFERTAIKQDIKELEKLGDAIESENLVDIFNRSETYRDSLYLQIIESRLETIDSIKKDISENVLEKVLQQKIFDNLWLLDPSWEGASGESSIEHQLSSLYNELFDSTGEQSDIKHKGRIDIKYRSSAGKHVIVELKRFNREISIEDLKSQGGKYYEAVRDVLNKSERFGEQIEVVFILGKSPKVSPIGKESEIPVPDYIEKQLEAINGRVLYYNQIYDNAFNSYKSFYDKRRQALSVDSVIDEIDKFFLLDAEAE